jgi:formylglycine-generating enzyme required for sulfatase activity
MRIRGSLKYMHAVWSIVAWCSLMLLLFAGGAGAQMVRFAAAEFAMGSRSGEDDERPVHRVRLDAFSIDVHEVSAAAYDSCVAAGACTPASYDDGQCLMWTSEGVRTVKVPPRYRSPRFPVVCVSWSQARAYCRFKGKRLPTEAEWEYAASGGDTRVYAWGNQNNNGARCATAKNRHPLPVGSFAPGPGGVYDMTGNVWEWTQDRYQKDYYAHSPASNPEGPMVGRYRVIRGGGWYSGAAQLRLRNRQWLPPERGEVSVGFRCAR